MPIQSTGSIPSINVILSTILLLDKLPDASGFPPGKNNSKKHHTSWHNRHYTSIQEYSYLPIFNMNEPVTQITAEQWQSWRPEIQRLYVDEEFHLKRVLSFLRKKGFCPS